MTGSGGSQAGDVPVDGAAPGRSQTAPPGEQAPPHGVVDFGVLSSGEHRPPPEVVDFEALVETTSEDGAGVGGPDTFGQRRTVLPATVAELSVLAEEPGPVEVPVADIASAGRRPRGAGGRAGRDRSARPARTSTSEPDPSVGDDDGDTGAPAGRRAARRSSFGDSGSRSFGGRTRGGRTSTPRRQREWGIQLDADVDEPGAGAGVTSAGAESTGAESTGTVLDGGGPGRGRSAGRGRGRAGSFGRARRAEGEPPPEYEDPEQAARQICLTALTGASRTRQQLADLLAAREVPDEAAEAVLERFTEVGLIDDAAFAAAWVSSRQSGRGLSRRALADELRRKGVDQEVASAALEAVDPQDEWDTARALVARKVPGMRRLDSATATRRLTAMLARKGYGSGLSAWVVREALEADGKAEDAAAEADDAPPEVPTSPAADVEPGAAPVRRGLWSGRPLDEVAVPAAEVGGGLGVDGWARARSNRPRPR